MFSPDWCFGLIKQLYRRTKVGSLKSIAEVINKSAECNVAQLVSREDSSTIVPMCMWANFLTLHFKKIPGIKTFHHFRMLQATLGVMFVKEQADSLKKRFNLLVSQCSRTASTTWLECKMSIKQIRPFCPDDDKDLTCPIPSVPKPDRGTTPAPEDPHAAAASPPKRQRTCGTCRGKSTQQPYMPK